MNDANQVSTPAAPAEAVAAQLKFNQEISFRAPKETRVEIAQKCFPDYAGKPENILAWPRDKANTNTEAKKKYVQETKAAEEKYNAAIVIPNPAALTPDEILALFMSNGVALATKQMNAARRKQEEIPVEFEFGILDLLEESEDEESVGSTRLSEEEQELYTSLVDEFIRVRNYKEVSPASYAIATIALNGKAKEMLHAIKNAKHFVKFHEVFAGWIDEANADQRPLVERALKRQTRYQQKAQAEYDKIVGSTAQDDIVA